MVEVVKADPADDLAWLALADYLEESGQPGPSELHRLSLALRRPTVAPRGPIEGRLRQMLASGLRPVVPTEVIRLGTGVESKLALVPPGSFLMGSSEREPGRSADEGPAHRVNLTSGFYLGIHPVTQAQWRRMIGSKVSVFQGDDRPVDNVPWEECQMFCAKLTNGTGRRFRLPTEAEWEYACRAGTTSPFHFGRSISIKQANYDGCTPYDGGRKGTYRQHTMSVGSFLPNAFGLFDMHGNVNEWCLDAYSDNSYRFSAEDDPRSYGAEGCPRVARGGAWCNDPERCRSASRTGSRRRGTNGFRIVLEV